MSFWEFIKYCFWCMINMFYIVPPSHVEEMSAMDNLTGILTLIVVGGVIIAIILIFRKIITTPWDKK